MKQVALHWLAHSRAGDKGDTLNLSLIAWRAEDFALLAEQVTPARVAAHFAGWVKGPVVRYDLPNLAAFNFVLSGALAGGVNESLRLDTHGKSMSGILLALPVTVPDDHPCASRSR